MRNEIVIEEDTITLDVGPDVDHPTLTRLLLTALTGGLPPVEDKRVTNQRHMSSLLLIENATLRAKVRNALEAVAGLLKLTPFFRFTSIGINQLFRSPIGDEAMAIVGDLAGAMPKRTVLAALVGKTPGHVAHLIVPTGRLEDLMSTDGGEDGRLLLTELLVHFPIIRVGKPAEVQPIPDVPAIPFEQFIEPGHDAGYRYGDRLPAPVPTPAPAPPT